jgi:hypothetical protein
MSVKIDALAAKVDSLGTALTSLVSLTDTLKADLDALIAGGSLSPADAATVQAISDKIDTDVAAITATVTKDTPAPPAP